MTPAAEKDLPDLAAAALSQTVAGVNALHAVLDLGEAVEGMDADGRRAVRICLDHLFPNEEDPDLRRRNPVIVPDRDPGNGDGKEAA